MPVVWPTLLDFSRDECKRILRKLELEAYAGVISALRAQGDLSKEKKDLLGELSKVLSISTERHRAEVRRAVNDERLTTIAHNMFGPNSSSEWSIEGRRLVPLMPRLVPQTAFTATANAIANVAGQHNASLPDPAETGNKEVVVCYSYTSTTSTPTSTPVPSGSVATVKSPRPASPASNVVVLPSGSTVYVKSVNCSDDDEKPRKRRRTNSSSSSPVVLKDVPKPTTPVSKTITVPVSGSPKMSNIMQSIANSLPPHMSPVKITFTKPTTQTTNTSTQKVIIVTTSPSSTFVPNILSKSHNYAAVTKLVPTSVITSTTQKPPVMVSSAHTPAISSTIGNAPSASLSTGCVAVTAVVSSTPSLVMSTMAQGASTSTVKVASNRLPSPKNLIGSPGQILAQFPKHYQQLPKHQIHQMSTQAPPMSQPSTITQPAPTPPPQVPPGIKPTIQIKQESARIVQLYSMAFKDRSNAMMSLPSEAGSVKIITQQMQPSKILPKPVSAALTSSSNAPIMVVSSNGAIMTTKLVTTPSGTQATYTRPAVSSALSARMAATPGATYVKTTSGSIITVVPKSLATLGGKIISSNIVSGTTTKITTIPMTSKPNVIVVQKTTGKGTTIQGIPGKNVVTTLLNASGDKALQAVPAGAKPAIITASRPITKMIVTQPKGIGSTVQPATKIIPTKIVYGQQGKTQVLIKPKPVTFQATVMSEQTRQLVTETLQQASRVVETTSATIQEVKEDTESSSSSTESSQSSQDSQPVVHVIASRGQEWSEHEIAMDTTPTIIYQDIAGESQSATSTIKALMELQQTSMKEKVDTKPRQLTIDLSQMAVPLQKAPDKRQPESPSFSVVESELVAEYLSTASAPVLNQGRKRAGSNIEHRIMLPVVLHGKTRPMASTTTVSSRDVPLSSILQVSHPSQHHQLQSSQSSRTVLQHVTQSQSAAQASVVVKSIPTSSSGAITHLMQQALSSHAAFKRIEETVTEEGEVEEMDTLDPQTGLFYRSALAQKHHKQIHLHQEGAHLQVKTVQSLQTKQKQIIQLQSEAFQHKIQQTAQLSFRQRLTPAQQEQVQQHAQRHMLVKERHIPSLVSQPQQTVVQVLAVKTTQQLPKLQQVPGQQKIYMQSPLSQTPVQLPVASEKQMSSQVTFCRVTQPVVSQGSAVTKITFEGHQPPTVSKATVSECLPKLTPAMASLLPALPLSEKASVADILKMSMMEAEIETNVEPMIVDTPSKAAPIIKPMPVLTEAVIPPQVQRLSAPSTVTSTVPPLPKCFPAPIITATTSTALPVPLPPPPPLTRKVDVPVASQIIQIQNVPPKRTEEIPSEIIIQTIPQYPIACHSSSNVVVEPSGLLELNNFTSQQLGDDDAVIINDSDITSDDRTQCKTSINLEHA
ncbi:BRCA2-interacting transcriptional repressor EMSY isoform X3 [Rana temporaria]|uniref:BRCA2-interacting transcriptional repressor EMSY isoform X3 n=1 Tax=Rana temporaria TaxID=8407 RepID=UPI001AAE15A4|nr:BRCA2-interacting transcriptional repressor EMSY isoform X3 [Rana temporaria]